VADAAGQADWATAMARLLVEINTTVDRARHDGATGLHPDLLARYRTRYGQLIEAGWTANPNSPARHTTKRCRAVNLLDWRAPFLSDRCPTWIADLGGRNRVTQGRRNYTAEYREEAVRLVLDSSRSVAAVARELGVNEGTLGNWVNRDRREHVDDEPQLAVNERARLRELEKQSRDLRMENEFLKKAAAFFARKQQ